MQSQSQESGGAKFPYMVMCSNVKLSLIFTPIMPCPQLLPITTSTILMKDTSRMKMAALVTFGKMFSGCL